MKRRLDLALALVHGPRILFLDEPTTGLDPQSRAALWDEVARLAHDEGMTVFLTTQYLAPVYVPLSLLTGWIHDVARLNPATVVLEAGRGLLAGSPVKVGLAFVLLAGSAALLAIFARRSLASAERAG